MALELHLYYTCLCARYCAKSAQNNSYNCVPDAALEGTLHGELNVALEGAR